MEQWLQTIDGPPPLTKEQIKEIPTTCISQDHLGKNYFKLSKYIIF